MRVLMDILDRVRCEDGVATAVFFVTCAKLFDDVMGLTVHCERNCGDDISGFGEHCVE